MKTILCGLLLMALTVMAADVSGKWAGTFGEHDLVLQLNQKANTIVGTAGPPDGQWPIKNGKIEGSKISFDLEAPQGTIKFQLVAEGDRIQGEATGLGNMSFQVAAKRVQ